MRSLIISKLVYPAILLILFIIAILSIFQIKKDFDKKYEILQAVNTSLQQKLENTQDILENNIKVINSLNVTNKYQLSVIKKLSNEHNVPVIQRIPIPTEKPIIIVKYKNFNKLDILKKEYKYQKKLDQIIIYNLRKTITEQSEQLAEYKNYFNQLNEFNQFQPKLSKH